jgi:hypothetical protein
MLSGGYGAVQIVVQQDSPLLAHGVALATHWIAYISST